MSVPYNDWLSTLTRKAALRERAGLRRSAVPRAAAIDLAGNDYLGLSSHPLVLEAAGRALAEYGLGATGSRLVRGTTERHDDLERALAGWIGAERALVYSSGYLSNLGVIRALSGLSPASLILADAHCHASMVDGCRLAKAETIVFEHGSVEALEKLLKAHPGRPKLVLTESVFSVDGDLAPLVDLHAVSRAHGALLMVDDAHGLGVVGPSGAGGASFLAGEGDVVITATLSKALGGAGGVVAGPDPLIRHLIDTSRTFIFDTALPPAVAAGVRVAVDIAREGDSLRSELRERAELIEKGTAAGVVSMRAASAEAALAWAAACKDNGVAVGCFRPPSTPDGSSRLRLTVNVGVPREKFEHALEVIERCRPFAE